MKGSPAIINFSWLIDAETSLETAKSLFAAARLITLKSKDLEEHEVQELNSLLTIAFDIFEYGEELAKQRFFEPEKQALARRIVRKQQKSAKPQNAELKIAA